MLILDNLLLKMAFYPITSFVNIMEKIYNEAWEELYGPDNIKRELLRWQLSLESGEVTEEQYDKAERILLERLEVANEAWEG